MSVNDPHDPMIQREQLISGKYDHSYTNNHEEKI